ncbi:MAG: hypothetical protein QNJ97_13420 [Myxococcota bacterium]|nr:hypothetical protein [Myxococcota bacterium]
MSKEDTLLQLSAILAEMYDIRHQGAPAARFYKAQGLADGYMRALRDLDIFSDDELLVCVNREKRRAGLRVNASAFSAPSIQAAPELST